MDVPELLDLAATSVPAAATTDAGATIQDAREYLDYREWELALDILTELADDFPAAISWWDLLIGAAERMGLTRRAAWCHWRRWETIHGVFRAELSLPATVDGGRRTPIPGHGVLRPLWDIGLRTAAGEPDLRVARIWVEYVPELAPGTTGSVRLAPLDPVSWHHHLHPGDVITMHEFRSPSGIAAVLEVSAPTS